MNISMRRGKGTAAEGGPPTPTEGPCEGAARGGSQVLEGACCVWPSPQNSPGRSCPWSLGEEPGSGGAANTGRDTGRGARTLCGVPCSAPQPLSTARSVSRSSARPFCIPAACQWDAPPSLPALTSRHPLTTTATGPQCLWRGPRTGLAPRHTNRRDLSDSSPRPAPAGCSLKWWRWVAGRSP